MSPLPSTHVGHKNGIAGLMIRKSPRGDLTVVHDSAFVDPTAIVCGRVVVHENVFIGPYAVIRADEVDTNGHMEAIVIGAHSNIQDGVVIHSTSGAAVTIGERTSIAHRAIVHGPCSVGDGAFIGFNSVLFNCAVGEGCVVGHNAVVDGRDLHGWALRPLRTACRTPHRPRHPPSELAPYQPITRLRIPTTVP